MINSILLENFQSHKKTEIKFSPGVNSIIGSSDSGKTAILRGLRKAVQNKPGGTAFRSNWGGDTSIKVETDDAVFVSRVITDADNLYFLEHSNGKDKFKAFGQGVPDEIASALNMDDENVQSQMDAPFLFSATDGEVARRLNEAANLKMIDRSQSRLNGLIKEYTSGIKQTKKDIIQYTEDLTSTDFIEEAEEVLIKIEVLEKECDVKEQEVSDLDYLITTIEETEEEQKSFLFIPDALKTLEELRALLKEDSDKETKTSALANLINELKEIESALENTIDTVSAEKAVDLLICYNEGVEDKEKSIGDLEDVIEDINDVDEEYKELLEETEDNKKKFDDMMPYVCPLCGGEPS